ncbi:MAG TPA: DUF3817 domain-containing protein [Acidimicrobiia bacterium]|nr:DUF3817 domain-containing protein [Acidimicrobiia bacterium]
MPDFADDESSELERKSRALAVMALVETVSYLVLFYFWVIAPNDIARALVGFFHGLVWLAFVSMVVLIRESIGWTWGYTVLVVVTGPIGGIMVFTRIKRTPRELLVPPRPHVQGR